MNGSFFIGELANMEPGRNGAKRFLGSFPPPIRRKQLRSSPLCRVGMLAVASCMGVWQVAIRAAPVAGSPSEESARARCRDLSERMRHEHVDVNFTGSIVGSA